MLIEGIGKVSHLFLDIQVGASNATVYGRQRGKMKTENTEEWAKLRAVEGSC